MEANELIDIIKRGEDSKHQFKADIKNVDSLAAEMAAFCNSEGGQLIIGLSENGNASGLTSVDIGRLNQLVSNAASQSLHPPINPKTENIQLSDGLVMIITLSNGVSKPYMDNNGVIWVKSGADKRRATSREEIQRIYQAAGLIHGDEIPANGMILNDFDFDYFLKFFEKQYGEPIEKQDAIIEKTLENMNLMKDGVLNIAGALLFTKTLEFKLSAFCVKCVSYPGNDIHSIEYRDSEDISLKLEETFNRTMSFITRNIHHIQDNQNINSLGKLEIPKIVFEELVTNALIHRDYFILAPIRIFIFDNRVEIISPGHLPNNLTIENIINGNSNIRNPILASFATKILPYRGLGNGIRRALKEYPEIEFNNDKEGNLFKAIIKRKATS